MDKVLFGIGGEKPEVLENGWEINAVEYLRQALQTGSVWTSKIGGVPLIVEKLDNVKKEVITLLEGSYPLVRLSIGDLLKDYNPPGLEFEYRGEVEYGATCVSCKRYFNHQVMKSDFKCWACRNGY